MNLAVNGECSFEDDVVDAVVGDATMALPGPFKAAIFDFPLLIDASSALSFPAPPATASLAAPTEAFSRLYRPLKPLCTISSAKPRPSPLLPGLGDAKSSNVVRVSDREALVCISSKAEESLSLVKAG